jgi:hypothetical protein
MSYSNLAPSRATFSDLDSERIKKYFGAYRYLYNKELAELMQMTQDQIKTEYESFAGGSIYLALEGFCSESDFLNEIGGYDADIIDAFCRSITILMHNDLADANLDVSKMAFLKKKDVQTIFVETRYPGKNCFLVMFPKSVSDKLLEHDDLFQTYDLTVDFDKKTVEAKYRQLV